MMLHRQGLAWALGRVVAAAFAAQCDQVARIVFVDALPLNATGKVE